MGNPQSWPRPPALSTGLHGRCPRCGQGRLLKGLLEVRDRCEVCHLDLTNHDSGDGPAVFVILVLGAVVVALALALETALQPPIWVHLLIWIPFITIASVAMLRPFKGVLVALHYRNRGHEYPDDA